MNAADAVAPCTWLHHDCPLCMRSASTVCSRAPGTAGCGSTGRPATSAADVADVLEAIAPRVPARFARAGLEDDVRADACAEAEPGVAGLPAASVQGVLALGGVSGRRPQRLGRGNGRTPEIAQPAPRPDMTHAREKVSVWTQG